MAGFGLQALKRHPSLVPLVLIVGGGCVMSGLYLFRIAVRSPEVTWNKHTNPEPWNAYDKKQYKLYAAGRDYNAIEERPKF